MKKAKTLQICGTGSGVGKSIIVAGVCRLLKQEGYRVAPFKAQNMALNSAVTKDGLEIGRAQAMQAAACGIEPTFDMNPVLLKPTSSVGSQVIVAGKPVGNMTAMEYYAYKSIAFEQVKESLDRLMREFDCVVIEGAGSPAEINLKKHDIVNMKIASMINAPVILVGDIDRGGVFAWLVGTMELLEEEERDLIKGFIINKFRGDKRLLEEGLTFLEGKTKKKILGVIPYFNDITLPEEDSLFFDQRKQNSQSSESSKLQIRVVRLPHISNFTDFDVLEKEDDLILEYTTDPRLLQSADCIIIPGTKNTFNDLQFLYDHGLAEIIKRRAEEGVRIIGICGGYQMLGVHIKDESGQETKKGPVEGLNLLKVETFYEQGKCTHQVRGKCLRTGFSIKGYEIHHGQTINLGASEPLFEIERGATGIQLQDGTQNSTGKIWGTYIHGIFDNRDFKNWLLNTMREEKGMPCQESGETLDLNKQLDALAELLRQNMDMQLFSSIMSKEGTEEQRHKG